jgi:hypothetical protein
MQGRQQESWWEKVRKVQTFMIQNLCTALRNNFSRLKKLNCHIPIVGTIIPWRTIELNTWLLGYLFSVKGQEWLIPYSLNQPREDLDKGI